MTAETASLFRKGVLLRREAIELGIDDEALTKGVRSKVLVRVRQGAYVDHAEWQAALPAARHLLLTEAARRIYGANVMVSHASAVVEHGGPTFGLDLSVVNVTHSAGSGRTQGSVRHHAGMPQSNDIRLADGSMVTSIPRTVVETTIQSRRVDVGVVLASHFLHAGTVQHDDLERARVYAGERPGSLVVRTALALADHRLESVAEARCWYILRRHTAWRVVPQRRVSDHKSFESRIDFALEELGIWIEVDGNEKYFRFRRPGESLEDFLLRERRRENRIRELTGWDVLRVTWADLAHPDRLIQRIADLHARRASR